MTIAWKIRPLNINMRSTGPRAVVLAIALLSVQGFPEAIANTTDLALAPMSPNAIVPGPLALAPLFPDAMVQVTPVFELREQTAQGINSRPDRGLRDIFPSDWAYDAVESLINRYNIPLGFPDGTYRGDRPLTRYELAAAMIPVLDRLTETVLTTEEQLVRRRDLAIIERLQGDFEAILLESEERLTELETRTVALEDQNFSSTTQLNGEGILALTDQGGNTDATETTGQYRVWLDVSSHFSNRDSLHARLIMSDSDGLGNDDSASPSIGVMQTAEGTLIQNSRGNTQDSVELDWLNYSRSLGDRTAPPINLYISAKGGIHSHYVDPLSPFGDGFKGDGAISVFGQTSPIYTIGGGAGIGAEWVLDANETIRVAAGYLAEQAASPDAGLLNQDYAALGQLTLRPTSNVQLGLTYVHGYHSPGNALFDAGLDGAITGTGVANSTHSFLNTPAITHSYGVQTTVELNNLLSLYGFGGYTDIRFIDQGDGELWFYGLGLGVENWLIPQTSGGLIIGSEPYLAGFDHTGLKVGDDIPLHVEAFYTLRLSDQVSISPGLIWLTAPNQDRDNRDRIIATLRTTFKF